MQLALVVVLVALATCSRALEYSDLEQMGIATCPDKNSCDMIPENSRFSERNCECDLSCTAYGDCCIDGPQLSVRRTPPRRLICLPYGNDSYQGAYVISSCPRGYSESQEILRQCQNNNFRDPLMSTPVSDTRNRRNYLNRYCAYCNGAQDQDMRTWIVQACKVERNRAGSISWDDLVYREDLGKWGLRQEGDGFEVCQFKFDKPSDVTRVRDCWSNVVSTCGRNWKRQQYVEQCQSYMSVVSDAGSRVFRNPHCAVCNNVPVSEIACLNPNLSRRKSKPFSFALLVDVNTSDGDIVGVSRRCGSNQKYDPFFKRCRSLTCAIPGHRLVNGKCVAQ